MLACEAKENACDGEVNEALALLERALYVVNARPSLPAFGEHDLYNIKLHRLSLKPVLPQVKLRELLYLRNLARVDVVGGAVACAFNERFNFGEDDAPGALADDVKLAELAAEIRVEDSVALAPEVAPSRTFPAFAKLQGFFRQPRR